LHDIFMTNVEVSDIKKAHIAVSLILLVAETGMVIT
jgi:hypothetical protein